MLGTTNIKFDFISFTLARYALLPFAYLPAISIFISLTATFISPNTCTHISCLNTETFQDISNQHFTTCSLLEYMQSARTRTSQESDHLQDLSIDERIILK